MKSLGKFPDPFLREILAQPAAIRHAVSALATRQRELEQLRWAGRRARTIVFSGMGGSYNACYPAVNELAARGIPALQVDAAELLHFRERILSPSALLVLVSQSGRSAEPVRLSTALAERSPRPFVVSITNGLDNRVAEAADIGLDTGAGNEVGPSTMTFAASLVALAATSRVLAGDPPMLVMEGVRGASEAAVRAFDRLLADPTERARELHGWLAGRDVLVLLGRGPARAAAEMGALVVKEATGLPAEAIETGQFRHGPVELAGPHLAAVVFATEPETRDLDVALASALHRAGAGVLTISREGAAPDGGRSVRTGNLDRALLPAVSIVPVQLIAWRLAQDRGRRPDLLSHAAKVTTHE